MSSLYALPQNVSQEQFEAAIRDFQQLLGDENVRTDQETVDIYVQDLPPGRRDGHMPSAVFYPGSPEDVQGIVRLANTHKMPLWPVYTTENFGYGSSAPATRGQIIVDTKRMNKVVEIDDFLAYALVEPGMTYADMRRYLEEHDMDLWIDRPPSDLGSPVGNVVERNGGYTSYSDSYFFSCGMEVVMPDGDLVRTGMGGVPNSSAFNVFKWGIGPSIDGLISQGNMGIITKMGIWLIPKPAGYKPFLMTFPKEMIGGIVAVARALRGGNLIQNACVISTAEQEAAIRRRYGPPEEASRTDHDAALYLYGALYGTTAEHVPVTWNYVAGAFQQMAGDKVRIYTEEDLVDDIAFEYRKQLMRGDLRLEANPGFSVSGMRFSAIGPGRAQDGEMQATLAREILGRYGFEYRAEMVMGWRCFTHGIDLSFDHDDPAQVERAYACYGELLQAYAEQGYGVDRTNVDFMKQVADTYGPEIQSVWRTLKESLDPNNIIAPGKSGISLG